MKEKRKNQGFVGIVRQPFFDYKYATVDHNKIGGYKWDNVSGGVNQYHKGWRIYAYIDYEIAVDCGISCSGSHGGYNNDVKVCIVKKYTDSKIYKEIINKIGHRPN